MIDEKVAAASDSSLAEPDKPGTRTGELEQAVAAEREHSAELRKAADELRFQMDILERSYSKQLEDARQMTESSEKSRDELAIRVAELDQARQDAIELLTEASAEIDRLTAERNQLRRQLASRDGLEIDPANPELAADPDENTINTLLDDDSWMRRTTPQPERQSQDPVSRSQDDDEEFSQDMLDPALVMSASRSRD